MGGQGKADAEFFQRLNGLQPLDGVGGHGLPRRGDQIGIGPVVRTPHPPAQLIQLRQTEFIGPLDNDGIGRRHINAGFNDRGTDQHIKAAVVKIQHHRLQLFLRHLPMRDPDAGLGQQLLDPGRGPFDGPDLVMQIKHLPAALDLAQQGLFEQAVVALQHAGLDRQPARGRGGDDGQFAQVRQRHIQRARDRRRGQRQHIDLGAQRLKPLLLPHAEAVFLIDHEQARILEAQIGL